MNRNNYGCFITLIIAIIFGIIVGYNAYITLIPGIVAALWIGFGIGIGALIVLTIISLVAYGKKEKCVYKIGKCIAVPAVGTVITTIIGLAITITAESIGIAILLGLATLFLTITIFNILRLVICLINENGKCRE